MIAAILESGELTRIYTGLSLLVSAAAEGEEARGLVSFGALEAMLADDLDARAAARGPVFARSLVELRETAAALEGCRIWACAAATEAAGIADVGSRLDGVMSIPRFLEETAGARLVVV